VRSLSVTLINPRAFNCILKVTKLSFAYPQVGSFTEDELIVMYINSILCTADVLAYKSLSQLLQFLQLVVQNQDLTKMGMKAIATVFAPLLFPCFTESVGDISKIIEESELHTEVLEGILRRLFRCPDWYEKPQTKMITSQTKCSGEVLGQTLIRGDIANVFFKSDRIICFEVDFCIFVVDAEAEGREYLSLVEKSSSSSFSPLRSARGKALKTRRRLSSKFASTIHK